MDLLHRGYVQWHGLWRSLSPGSRMAAGLLAIAMLLGLVYVGTRPAPGPDAELLRGMPVSAGEWSAMVSALAKANLKGYEIRGNSIFVPRGEEPTYLAALADAQALPLGIGGVMRKSVEAGNPFESREQREQRTKIAQQDVLAGIIRSMVGIETAYVLYDIDNRPGGFQQKLITATVSVKAVGSAQIDEDRVLAIRHLVAGAIAGLKPENVTIVDLNGRTWYGNTNESRGADESLYVSLQQCYERDLKSKILGALSFIPNVTAETRVVLDRQEIARTRQANDNDGRGDAAVGANTAAAISGSSAALRCVKGSSAPISTQSRVTVISARVSVGVPASYFRKVWQEQQSQMSDQRSAMPDTAALKKISEEESAKIRRHVAQLLPPTQSASDPSEQVTVTTFENIETPKPPAPLAEQAWSWLAASWQRAALAGFAVVALFALAIAMRAGRAPTPAVDDSLGGNAWQESSRVPAPHWNRSTTGRSPNRLASIEDAAIARHVSELVEADPEAAAGILRNWIGQTD